MPPVSRYRILLVDPVKLRRDRAAEATRLRFDIVGAGTLADAMAVTTGTVHAVVLTLKQVEENGLALAKKLREKFGPEPYFVVHGPSVPARSTEERAMLAERHKVDMWLPNALEPDGLEVALWSELERRFRPKERPKSSVESADDEPSWSELLRAPPSVENVRKLLTKDLGGPIKRRI